MKPKIGQWYQLQLGDKAMVVAYDEEEELIELQYEDGDVEEMDIDDWNYFVGEGMFHEDDPPRRAEHGVYADDQDPVEEEV